jgi:hypothetical protein
MKIRFPTNRILFSGKGIVRARNRLPPSISKSIPLLIGCVKLGFYTRKTLVLAIMYAELENRGSSVCVNLNDVKLMVDGSVVVVANELSL